MRGERLAKLALIGLALAGSLAALVAEVGDPRLVVVGVLVALLLGLPGVERITALLEGREPYQARRKAYAAAREARRVLRRYSYRISQHLRAEAEAALSQAEAALPGADAAALDQAARALEALLQGPLVFARKGALREAVEAMAGGIFVILLFRAFVAEGFEIPSGSMIPTLEVGDYVEVSKSTYGLRLPFADERLIELSAPRRGDIVIFVHPNPLRPEDRDKVLIKRVVAVAGDELEISRGVLSINGREVPLEPEGIYEYTEERGGRTVTRRARRFTEELDGRRHPVLYALEPESFCDVSQELRCWPRYDGGFLGGRCRWPARFCVAPEAASAPLRIPEGHVFVMGDNRDDSEDSRYWGPLPVEAIRGKALFVPFSGELIPPSFHGERLFLLLE
jgi:signal peptidase I